MSSCKISHYKVLNELTDIHEITASISYSQYAYSFEFYTSRVFQYSTVHAFYPFASTWLKILKHLYSMYTFTLVC